MFLATHRYTDQTGDAWYLRHDHLYAVLKRHNVTTQAIPLEIPQATLHVMQYLQFA